MRLNSVKLLSLLFFLFSCSHDTSSVEAQKISQFDQAGTSDLLIDKNGTYHAVFQEATQWGKPVWIYYSTSTNKGVTWSKPVTLSNDNTGNGASYPRILQDGSGKIYVIWLRFGKTGDTYPVASPTLDGPGGYNAGTIFYKVLNGGAWSQQIQLNENEQSQISWFPAVSPQGKLYVFWTQFSQQFIHNKLGGMPYFADYLRVIALDGTNKSAIVDLSTPSPEAYAGGYPVKQDGGWNMEGLVDKAGTPHFLYECYEDPKDAGSSRGPQVIKYYDGKAQRTVYTYPGNARGNSFNWPAKLLVDEKGADHMIFMPANSNLEDQQLWDVNLTTNETNVLLHLPESVGTLENFQATQGPGGQMAVTFEMSMRLKNTEAYGMFYKNGSWTKMGLTKNAAQEKFFSKDFIGVYGWPTNITTSTTYNSRFASVAYDPNTGKKGMLMTLVAHFLTSAFSTDSPSLIYMPIDR